MFIQQFVQKEEKKWKIIILFSRIVDSNGSKIKENYFIRYTKKLHLCSELVGNVIPTFYAESQAALKSVTA